MPGYVTDVLLQDNTGRIYHACSHLEMLVYDIESRVFFFVADVEYAKFSKMISVAHRVVPTTRYVFYENSIRI